MASSIQIVGFMVGLLALVVSVRKSATRFAAVGRPGGPTLCVDQSAAMNAWLTPLMFMVKQPCSIAE